MHTYCFTDWSTLGGNYRERHETEIVVTYSTPGQLMMEPRSINFLNISKQTSRQQQVVLYHFWKVGGWAYEER